MKIIDLEAGEQPFLSEDGDTILVFNGEIYNYRELRAELESLGHSFTSDSDTEVLLRAFLAWDTRCFARLRGMFALALWNEKERRLVLARDRVGIKPLYFHRSGSDIYFGSELKAIFTHKDIPRRLDFVALQYYLALNYVPGPYTLVEGIQKVRPGHFLEWRRGEFRETPYWQPSFERTRTWTLSDAAEALDERMQAAVRDHLVADVPLGIWISGGIDSSALLHYASQIYSGKLRTFSVTFHGRSFDEASYIKTIVDKYATEHHEIDLNPTLDLPTAVEEIAYHSDEPFADAGAVPIWFLSKLTRSHVKVALSGEGADELFGGYLTYRADHLANHARKIPKVVRRSLLRALNYWPVSNDKISLEYKLKRFLEGSLLTADESHVYWNGCFSQAQQSDLLARCNQARVSDLYHSGLPAAPANGSLSRFLAFDQQYYLTDDLLQKVDRMSMAHSLEVRPPYLDHRLIEFAATLPDQFKLTGNCHKLILKRAMASKLPRSILRRPKIGLDIPTHDWLRGPLRSFLDDTLTTEAVRATGLFRPGAIEKLKHDHAERRANLGYHLWGLLILFLWIKRWNIQTELDDRMLPFEVELDSKAVSS